MDHSVPSSATPIVRKSPIRSRNSNGDFPFSLSPVYNLSTFFSADLACENNPDEWWKKLYIVRFANRWKRVAVTMDCPLSRRSIIP